VSRHDEPQRHQRLVAHPLTPVLPQAGIDAAVAGDHGRQLPAARVEAVIEKNVAEARVRGPGPVLAGILFERVAADRRLVDGPAAGVERVHDPGPRVAARVKRQVPLDRGAPAPGLQAHITGRAGDDADRDLPRDPRGAPIRAVEALVHLDAVPAPIGKHRRHAVVLAPPNAQVARGRRAFSLRGHEPDDRRLEAARRIERQGLALPAETLGVHEQQAERRPFPAGRELHRGLDEAVAEEEVRRILEARPDIGVPLARVVVVEVLGRLDHHSLGMLSPPLTSTIIPVE
jgi:hypothetical protein